MLNSFAVLSVLTTTAFAQYTASSSGSSPLVPSDISKSCSDFLNKLDSNSDMSACTSSLISTTQGYGPGGNAPGTKDGISSTLSTLCGTSFSSNCPDSLIRTTLANFQTACATELTGGNDAVVRTYDIFYAISPLKNAICSKDDDGSWCLTKSADNLSGASRTEVSSVHPDLAQYLFVKTPVVKRDESAAMYPNTTTFCQNNLAFDFLKPSLANDTLCTTCTRNILTAYIQFETSVPYAPGLGQSQLLCGQSDLLNGVKSTCGDDFLNGAVQAAGGIKSGPLDGGSSAGFQLSANVKNVVAAAAGVVTLAFLSFN